MRELIEYDIVKHFKYETLTKEQQKAGLYTYHIVSLDEEYGGLIFMKEAPTLKELLSTRKENHATSIIVSTKNNKDLFKGNISELQEELLNIPIFAWDKRDGIYITIE